MSAAVWDRTTPWRQGSAIPPDAAARLGLTQRSADLALVISHDCDLAQGPRAEPYVEVIVAQRLDCPDGNFTYGKNPRRLHLFIEENGSKICVELSAQSKKLVAKSDLITDEPLRAIKLSSRDLAILQSWLAARYRRSAFPDEFERRLEERDINKKLSKILQQFGEYIIAVFFDLDEGEEVCHSPSDPFLLRIDLLYSTAMDPGFAENQAKKAAEAITELFHTQCRSKDTGIWQDIELLSCEPIADQAMTYEMSTRLRRWNAEHLSLRTDPPAPALID